MIGDDIEVTVLSLAGEKVRLGIQAPSDVPVYRNEIYLEIQRAGQPPDISSEARDPLREPGRPNDQG